MARIYTSYFGNLRNIEKRGMLPVSVSRWSPKWFNGQRYTELAPTSNLLNDFKQGIADEVSYAVRYDLQLAELSEAAVLQRLEEFARLSGKDVVLLCYERPGQFCHRHLLSKWLNRHIAGQRSDLQNIVEL